MSVSRRTFLAAAMACFVAWPPRSATPRAQRVLSAGPENYWRQLDRLQPGDELRLSRGIYRSGLPLTNLHGTEDHPILIRGPADRSALFLGRPGHNTVQLRRTSYLEIANLTLDGRNIPGVDGIKSQDITHHITLSRMELRNHAAHQQTVGISTKAPAWHWIIRDNIIRAAGTGMYFGDSNGTAPFVHGIIERNVIVGTIGYGLQIKHQNTRPDYIGMPTVPGSTIIRNNLISKSSQPRRGFQGPRPNLLVGHFPSRGPGVEDTYEIFGNLLYQNLVGEPLFQGEGNIAFHDNLLVNHHGDGIWIQPHNDRPRRITLHHNTIIAKGRGILMTGGYPDKRQIAARNAIFGAPPIEGGEQHENLSADYAEAARYLRSPSGGWRTLDLRPRPGRLYQPLPQSARSEPFVPAEADFAGNPRDGSYLGAYAGPRVAREGIVRFSSRL